MESIVKSWRLNKSVKRAIMVKIRNEQNGCLTKLSEEEGCLFGSVQGSVRGEL